jgi:thiol-disulfide isomerase/thioredoxin
MPRAIKFVRRSCLRALSVTLVIMTALVMQAAENPGKRPGGAPGAAATTGPAADVGNPIVQLVLDPLVQQELQLKELQTAALSAIYRKVEPRLWLLRDVSQGPHAEEKAKLLAAMESDLASLLEPAQLERLRQIAVRARGWSGITMGHAVAQLQLTPMQLQQIGEITTHTADELKRIASTGDSTAARNDAITQARTVEGVAIQQLLSPAQQQTLVQLVGKPYDLSTVRPLTFAAPELAQVDAWINSPPLKMSQLKGKVVAFHFWASGCINCVHNLPHYAKWHEQLSDKGLVVLGLHTPETSAERSVENLQSKVNEFKIRYPVAMDHEAGNWSAWANSMWPSVYLVDKTGRVRYWWYGELNWQGATGEQFMRQKIEELLVE